jgi:hypothetical protein
MPDPQTPVCRTPMRTFVMDDHSPSAQLSPKPIEMPGMISDEEAQYYDDLRAPRRGHRARSVAREIGTSFAALKGTRNSGADSCTYSTISCGARAGWMPDQQRPKNHASFRHLFGKHVCPVMAMRHRMAVPNLPNPCRSLPCRNIATQSKGRASPGRGNAHTIGIPQSLTTHCFSDVGR